MANVYESVCQRIGCTPLFRLGNLEEALELQAQVLAKVEGFNPSGSVKDRIARAMIEDAEDSGLLRTGSVIVEPTSGNTGVALASVAASRGYRVILVMPDFMATERREMLSAYGAELVLTDGALGMKGALEEAQRLVQTIPGAYMPGQFTNPANPRSHRETTGPEIWEGTGGDVDILVCGVGTGGTITGTGEYLREKNPRLRIVAVEPAASPVLSTGVAGVHGITGLGAGFVPAVLNTSLLDEILTVTDGEAAAGMRLLGHSEGLLTGMSGGAAIAAVAVLANRPENREKNIVIILPDMGKRYLAPVRVQ